MASRVPGDESVDVDALAAKLNAAVAAHDEGAATEAVSDFKTVFETAEEEQWSQLPDAILNLATALSVQFDNFNKPESLKEALCILHRHESTFPQNHPLCAAYLKILGRVHLQEALLLDEQAHVQASVERLRAALDIASPGHSLHDECELELGVSLIHRANMTGEVDDAQEAVQIFAALKERNDHSLSRAVVLACLGNAWVCAFHRRGGLDVLELNRGIEELRAATELAEASPGAATIHSDLGHALMRKYEHLSDHDALLESIRHHQEAVDATGDQHSQKSARLRSLASAQLSEHEHTMSLDAANDAVRNYRRAVRPASGGQDASSSGIYGLAGALFRRGQLTRVKQDLDEAADLAARAKSALEDGHPDRATRLAFFASAVCQSKNRILLTQAENDLKSALDMLTIEGPTRAMLESNLGSVLTARLESDTLLTPSQADAYSLEAVELTRAAVENMPREHTLYIGHLLNYANACAHLAEHTQDAYALDDALDRCRQAQNLPVAAPAQVQRAVAYAALLEQLYRRTGDESALRDALAQYTDGAGQDGAPPYLRLYAAYGGALLAAGADRYDTAVELSAIAIDQLDRVIWRGLDHRGQERVVAGFGTLPVDSAAMAVSAGRLEQAVELLERGRGILTERRIDDDQDIELVRPAAPALADEFLKLRSALDQVVVPDIDLEDVPHRPPHEASEADQRGELAVELDHVIERIRQVPGMPDVFQPCAFADLRAAVGTDPVVVINISSLRCDALVLTPGEITHIALPSLTITEAKQRAKFMLKNVKRTSSQLAQGQQAREGLVDLLDWLWTTIAEPALDAIGVPSTTSAEYAAPHLYWCPTGVGAFLPLHAAGSWNTVETDSSRSVIGRAASTYVPRLRALLPRSPRPETNATEPGELLIVSMPQTPGEALLPGATTEAADLLAHFPDALHLTGPAATKEAVLAALETHRFVHFSTHATVDGPTSLDGGLRLVNGILSIRDLSDHDLSHARFAFLSACETYRTAEEVPDEGITVGAALRIAGFEHVIATLWPISDSLSPEFSRSFYRHLIARETTNVRLRPEQSAEALRRAACDMRDQYPDEPHRWAAFIHTGSLTQR
jgi:tetratricopeptide (TPR) repeat protein